MSPLKFAATAKTIPSRSDDTEPFGAAHHADGKGFGDFMEHTLKRANQKSSDRQHQQSGQAADVEPKKKAKDAVDADDGETDAPTAKTDDSNKQQQSDPLVTPLSLATNLYFYPVNMDVAKVSSLIDGGGANVVALTDGKIPALAPPVDSKSLSGSRRFPLASGRAVASVALPVEGQGKSPAVVGEPAGADAAKASGKLPVALPTNDKMDAQSALHPAGKKETVAKAQEVGKNTDLPASEVKPGVAGVPLEVNGIGNSFMRSAELAMEAAGGAAAMEEQGQSTVVLAEKPSGISAAKQDSQMKKTDKKNNFAGAEKVLPEMPALKALGDNLPGRDQKLAVVPMSGERAEASANGSLNSLSSEHPIQVTAASVSGASLVSPVVDIRARAVDRTEEILMLQSTRVTDLSNETLKVTIRPGAGIELAVELHHGEKGIEASATLRNGDYHFLNSNWPDLQQRMESRGVRLSPLTCSEQFSNSNTNQFQQPQQQAGRQDEPAYAGAFADFVMAGSIAKQAAQTISPRGWESWA